MTKISLKKLLSADPVSIILPKPGTTELRFTAQAPGEVEIYYTIHSHYHARFVEDGKIKTKIIRKVTLSLSDWTTVCHTVHIGRRSKKLPNGSKKLPNKSFIIKETENFLIKATIIKKNGKGQEEDSYPTSCICTYFWNSAVGQSISGTNSEGNTGTKGGEE